MSSSVNSWNDDDLRMLTEGRGPKSGLVPIATRIPRGVHIGIPLQQQVDHLHVPGASRLYQGYMRISLADFGIGVNAPVEEAADGGQGAITSRPYELIRGSGALLERPRYPRDSCWQKAPA